MARTHESRRPLIHVCYSGHQSLSGTCPAIFHRAALEERLERHGCDAFTTLITLHEVTQGWLAEINRRRAGRDQLQPYKQFHLAIRSFENLTILPFDEEAAEQFHRLQSLRLNVGTMDLKIAAIAVSHSALLLSRNLRDFNKVPELRLENWLD